MHSSCKVSLFKHFCLYLTLFSACVYPAGSSKATQTEPAVSTSPMTAPSCGPEAWTTQSAPGIWERDGSCSSMTSHHRCERTYQQAASPHRTCKNCKAGNNRLLPLLSRSSLWATVQQENGSQWEWRAAMLRSFTSPSQTNTSFISTRAVFSPSSLPTVVSNWTSSWSILSFLVQVKTKSL